MMMVSGDLNEQEQEQEPVVPPSMGADASPENDDEENQGVDVGDSTSTSFLQKRTFEESNLSANYSDDEESENSDAYFREDFTDAEREDSSSDSDDSDKDPQEQDGEEIKLAPDDDPIGLDPNAEGIIEAQAEEKVDDSKYAEHLLADPAGAAAVPPPQEFQDDQDHPPPVQELDDSSNIGRIALLFLFSWKEKHRLTNVCVTELLVFMKLFLELILSFVAPLLSSLLAKIFPGYSLHRMYQHLGLTKRSQFDAYVICPDKACRCIKKISELSAQGPSYCGRKLFQESRVSVSSVF